MSERNSSLDRTPVRGLEFLIEEILIKEASENLPNGIRNADVTMLAMEIADQVRRWYSQHT